MSVLPDHEIIMFCEDHGMITPFSVNQVEPASYDVRLGNDFRVFQRDNTACIDLAKPVDITKLVTIADGEIFTLHPGEFVLGVTAERVHIPDNMVCRIEGKSSIGRLGLMVHVTAGYIDPGFRGPITLEMACMHPLAIKLRPGMLIAQLSFHYTSSPAKQPYRGRYQDATTVESSRYGMDIDRMTRS